MEAGYVSALVKMGKKKPSRINRHKRASYFVSAGKNFSAHHTAERGERNRRRRDRQKGLGYKDGEIGKTGWQLHSKALRLKQTDGCKSKSETEKSDRLPSSLCSTLAASLSLHSLATPVQMCMNNL